MADANLFTLIRSRCPADRTASCLEPVGRPSLSFADVDEHTARLATHLTRLGVRAGDRVVVQVEKSAESVLLYLACLRHGATYVPLNTAYTPAEVATFLADAEPHLLVCDPERRASLEASARTAGVPEIGTLDAAGAGTLAAYAGESADFSVCPRAEDAVAALLYTSGTTGRSKGAMLTHRNLASNALTLLRTWRWQADDVLLHALPLFHAHGLFVALHCALLGGSRVILLPRFDAGAVTAALAEATVYMGVPTHYTRLLERPDFDHGACRNARVFISGSAPLLERTHDAFAARTGHRILERYGMTEALMITSNPYDGDGGRVAGTVGFPLDGVEARVVGEAGGERPRGEAGALEIRGPNVFAGYWRLPEKTREEFCEDGFFRTGDLAVMAPDGRIRLVGRAKDLVISGGFNVYPAEVEAVVDAIAGVRESAVIGLPHPDFGEGVTAVVVPDGSRELDEAGIKGALESALARFKHPKRVFFVDALPRNAMGKVQKKALRERFSDTYST